MINCRYAHRSKSFIESKLKTQVEEQEKDDRSRETMNKSTQTKFQSVNSKQILALEKRIIELEKTLHAKEIMMNEFLADPVQFI